MIKEPSKATLKKYGLSLQEWRAILEKQGGVCAICHKEPKTGRLVIDHSHVKGWKSLPPEKRKLHIRGLLCWWDNKQIVGRGVTISKLKVAAAYLEEHERKLIDYALEAA